MDYSRQSTLFSCAAQYDFKYNRKLADDVGPAGGFGKLWHKMHELNVKSPRLTIDELGNDAARAIGFVSYPNDYRTLDKAKRAFAMWEKRWAHQPWAVMDSERKESVPLVERPDLEPRTVVLDGLVATGPDEDTMENLVLDYKTTGRLETDWITNYMNSNQFRSYFLAARYLYPDKNIAGVLVDLYHTTKGAVKTGRDEYETSGNHFYRLVVRPSAADLEQFIEDYALSLELRALYEKRKHWPRNDKACFMYGRRCAFLDICADARPAVREANLLAMSGYHHEDET